MMAPLLIDSRGLLKFGFIFVLTLVLVFLTGFFAGFQRAATIQQTGSVTQPLLLPDQKAIMQSSIEAHPPEVLAAGEGIDVDQPEIKVSISKNNTDIMSFQMKKTEQSVNMGPAKNSTDRTELVVSSAITPDVTSNVSAAPEFTEVAIASVPNELRKIKYSIQVGTYGRRVNAESMMRILQAKQYDAYITNNITKKGGVQYNVRYGYFADKKSAIHNLNKFKIDQDEAGDGYLVKFSADNIVNVADSMVMKPPVDSSTPKAQSISSKKPAAIPTEDIPGNISQAEIFPAGVLTENITKTN